ncbi:MAG: hypothetical protein V6Z82_02380 [Flavobacteriales bacterium]
MYDEKNQRAKKFGTLQPIARRVGQSQNGDSGNGTRYTGFEKHTDGFAIDALAPNHNGRI